MATRVWGVIHNCIDPSQISLLTPFTPPPPLLRALLAEFQLLMRKSVFDPTATPLAFHTIRIINRHSLLQQQTWGSSKKEKSSKQTELVKNQL